MISVMFSHSFCRRVCYLILNFSASTTFTMLQQMSWLSHTHTKESWSTSSSYILPFMWTERFCSLTAICLTTSWLKDYYCQSLPANLSYLKSHLILLPSDLISYFLQMFCCLLVLPIFLKHQKKKPSIKSPMTSPVLGSSLRSHLWLIWGFVYQLACCRAKIVLLGEVDSKFVTVFHFVSKASQL